MTGGPKLIAEADRFSSIMIYIKIPVSHRIISIASSHLSKQVYFKPCLIMVSYFVGEEDAMSIQYLKMYVGETKRCSCGHYFKLVSAL